MSVKQTSEKGQTVSVGSDAWLAGMELHDPDLNRLFWRHFWNHPIDERNNTYWHDDDTTPEDENHEWKPLPDFCNDWSAVKKVLRDSPHVIAPNYARGLTKRQRCRHVMLAMIFAANTAVSQPGGQSHE